MMCVPEYPDTRYFGPLGSQQRTGVIPQFLMSWRLFIGFVTACLPIMKNIHEIFMQVQNYLLWTQQKNCWRQIMSVSTSYHRHNGVTYAFPRSLTEVLWWRTHYPVKALLFMQENWYCNDKESYLKLIHNDMKDLFLMPLFSLSLRSIYLKLLTLSASLLLLQTC